MLTLLPALAEPGAAGLAEWAEANTLDSALTGALEGFGLQYFTFHRLQAARLLGSLASPVRERWLDAYTRSVQAAVWRRRELERALRVLDEGGLAPVVLKGPALAYTAYPDPACRPMIDLDFWLPEDQVLPALAALEQAGYTYGPDATRPLALLRRQRGRVHLHGHLPASGHIDLHWSPIPGEWALRTAGIDEKGMWSRRVAVSIGSTPTCILAPEDTLIHLALHLAVLHRMAAPGVRALLDIVMVARSHPIDWQVTAERALAWRVATATWLVLDQAQRLLGLDECAPALTALAPGPSRRRLLRAVISSGAMLERRDTLSGRAGYGLLLLLADRPAGAAHLLWRGVWPEADWLAARYSDGRNLRLRHLQATLRGAP